MRPVDKYGFLRVEGGRLVGENGSGCRLFGMSTHGLAWRPEYVCFDTFKYLRDEWHTNAVRLAMYTHEFHGYCTDGDKKYLFSLMKKGIDLAIELGIYVIVDWHVLGEFSPLIYADEAERFFREITEYYGDCPNIIYEICNEPNGSCGWEEIREYAGRVIPVIRENAPRAVILVGTTEWSQHCDEALEAPLSFDNIMYSFHFYAATHFENLRSRLKKCLEAGLPVFISECSITEASGHGDIDLVSAREWFNIVDKYDLSYMVWSLSASRENSSIIADGCNKLSGWADEELKPTGQWFRKRFLSEK